MMLQVSAVRVFCPGDKFVFGPLRKFYKLSESSHSSSWWSSVFINKPRSQRLSSISAELTFPKDTTSDAEGENVRELQPKTKNTGKKSAKLDNSLDINLKPMTQTMRAIYEYFGVHGGLRMDEQTNLTNLLPQQCLKLTKTDPTLVYLINKSAAKTFANAIKSENPDPSSPILELHPGIGFLTSELINTIGYKYLNCLEGNAEVGKYLENKYNVTPIDCSTSDLPRHHHLDKHDGGERIHTILSRINTGGASVEDECKKKLHIVGTVPNISTINFLIRCYATKRVFFEDELPWNGVTLFLALGSKVNAICTAVPESGLVAYRPTSIFCQTLFKFKKIGVLPRDAFIPWEINDSVERKGPKTRKFTLKHSNILTVVRVDIREDSVKLIGRDNLFVYWYFVRQHLYARTNRIIPELERWCPGCGPRLIKQGFDIYSIFGKLSPEEILNLYLQFVSWPEFSSSSFLNAVEKFQTRVEVSEEDDH